MKLRTRLLVTFCTIVLLPIILSVLALGSAGVYMQMHAKDAYGLERMDMSLILDPAHGYTRLTDSEYLLLREAIRENPDNAVSEAYLEEMNVRLRAKSSFLIVRKESEIVYSGNEEKGAEIYEHLTPYGVPHQSAELGYYISDLHVVFRQMDFNYESGAIGSIFIVTKTTTFINRSAVRMMFISILIILLFTSFTLTRWIQKGVFRPITDLNTAMKNISEGNLDYRLAIPPETKREKSEIANLYVNYEQMRLQLKETADEKVENDNRNRELVSNISHDLKTPITSIKGYVEGIMDGVADTPEKMDRYIKTIYNKANDMDRLINELTTYSNIDANKIPYNFIRIHVTDYFNDCVEEVGIDLESKGIRLDYTNLVHPDTEIIADPEQIKRVINNIISNSVKYMDKPEGHIAIRLLDEVDSIRVEIEDNGRGIAAKELARIFERFYRTDSSRNSLQGGSGIGLSIVKKIVEDHGGYIWCTSKEGEGTCMHFVMRKYIPKEAEYEQNSDY